MDIWEFINKKLSEGINVMLIYVLESEGSSPGRKGFRMAVAADSDFMGTIGGGIMEHKFVEKAKSMMSQNIKDTLLMRQYHDKDHSVNQSGMICSGSQLNAFIGLSPETDLKTSGLILQHIKERNPVTVQLSQYGLELVEYEPYGFQYEAPTKWSYTESLFQQPVIHIIGGGHIGLALSEIMHFLDFHIKLYDDRPELNTIAANTFADEKHFIDYENLGKLFDKAAAEYLVIMTIGYRTDLVVLKQLLHKEFYYLGLLGSPHKIEVMYKELIAEGFFPDLLKKVHAPIGIDISSKTTKEIAISIAAEIVKKKNEG